ncbi:MAG: NAD(P)/FAD-dependent oxidoreductase [Candidatus Aminicenantes bacterium]|nr:MAG: NAD(P)/FAD-dependent oxidoreductase [Candidatus Aminicenantes bacterium]
MSDNIMERRDFLKTLLGGLSLAALNWEAFPKGTQESKGTNDFDAVVIGAGLGGLSCAAAFARQGFKALVLEHHSKPGGYATTFKRKGFVFDVSLHSTTVEERNGVHNLIPGFPEIKDIEFVPHPDLYRLILPDYDIRVPHKNLPGYIEILINHFPDEKEGIQGIFDDMKGLTKDIQKISEARGQVNMMTFRQDYPYLSQSVNQTWGQMLDARVKNTKLKFIISGLWGYYGLPPSKLASLYYAMPTIGYLQEGGYYPVGKSQKISDALMKFIEERGGKVMLRTGVEKILVKDHSAYGVKTADGQEFTGKVVVSNANAYDTFHSMMEEDDHLKSYLDRMDTFTASLSTFQVFLGLKKDLVNKVGIKDTEIFYETDYDIEASYKDALNADMENQGFGLTLYDNLYKGYSPEGKNTLNILNLQGYSHWEKYESDYFQGKKKAYRKEKERMADILIDKIEETLLPGLRKAIEVKEIGTPLTNVRYTKNYRGAIYGWDQTLDNSIPRRLPHKTPIQNLYLAGGWTQPGGGYAAVIPSGLECFGEIMQEWKGK